MKKNVATPIEAILGRDKSTEKNLLNLDGFYNHSLDDDIHHKPGNTLSDLPKGVQTLGGTKFDIRGVVQLSGLNSTEITTFVYPNEVKEIPVELKGDSIHFLQGSSWNIEADPLNIGTYVIHYTNGQKAEISIIYKENIWDWWGTPEENLPQVWKGNNVRTSERNLYTRLFKFSWKNPHPELEIKSIDLGSNNNGPGPFIVAVTVQ